MEGAKLATRRGTPTGWADVVVSSVKVAVVAFVILQLKEWFDAGAFDTTATAIDAALIAGGVFVVNALLLWVKSSDRQAS
jgi:hypothetical protein